MSQDNSQVFEFVIPLGEFDLSLLPAHACTFGTDHFKKAVGDYFAREFGQFGGWAQIAVDQQTIKVSWRRAPDAPDPIEILAQRLQRGDYQEPIRLLELLLKGRPDDIAILYNLGMALSDTGQPARAEMHLRRAVTLEPDGSRLWTALGVALVRQQKLEAAISAFRTGLSKNEEDAHAHRNLGACLLKAGDLAGAETHLRRAIEISPDDPQALFGMAQIHQAHGKLKEADALYAKIIDLDPAAGVAEAARRERRELAEKSFRSATPGLRPDAVMYCTDALRRFKGMARAEVQKIAFEIAILGQRGLDTNSPDQKYTLRSLPGTFSGLHLVCIMYVGFKTIAPDQNIGFDLSKEYEAAKALAG